MKPRFPRFARGAGSAFGSRRAGQTLAPNFSSPRCRVLSLEIVITECCQGRPTYGKDAA